MRRVVLLVLIAAVAVAAWLTTRDHHGSRASSRTAESTSPASTWGPPPSSPATATAAWATPTSTKTPNDLRGHALARAWLLAYLSRPSRDDEGWVGAVAPLSTPELVTDLRSAGPKLVGLDQLSSWQVTGVEPYEPINPPVDTESRQLLAYAATVTDGTHTEQKPFELYAYRQDEGRWLIGMVDQPYSSEG